MTIYLKEKHFLAPPEALLFSWINKAVSSVSYRLVLVGGYVTITWTSSLP